MAKPVLASGMRRPRPSATRTESAVEVPLNPEAEEAHHEGERLTELQALLDATPRRGGVGRDAALDDAHGVLEATPEAHDAHFERLAAGDAITPCAELQALLDATPRRGGVGRDAALDDAHGVLEATPEAHDAHFERLAAGDAITPCEELQALLDATPRRGGVGRDAALDDARGVLDAASRTHSTVSRKPRGVEHGVLDTHFTAVSRKFPSPWQQWFSYVKACSSQVCSFELIGERMNCPNASLYNSGSMLLTVTDNTQHTLLLFDTSVLFQALAREWLTWQSLMIGLVGSDAPCGRPLCRTRGQGFGVR
jgi:hypothetical protein